MTSVWGVLDKGLDRRIPRLQALHKMLPAKARGPQWVQAPILNLGPAAPLGGSSCYSTATSSESCLFSPSIPQAPSPPWCLDSPLGEMGQVACDFSLSHLLPLQRLPSVKARRSVYVLHPFPPDFKSPGQGSDLPGDTQHICGAARSRILIPRLCK